MVALNRKNAGNYDEKDVFRKTRDPASPVIRFNQGQSVWYRSYNGTNDRKTSPIDGIIEIIFPSISFERRDIQETYPKINAKTTGEIGRR